MDEGLQNGGQVVRYPAAVVEVTALEHRDAFLGGPAQGNQFVHLAHWPDHHRAQPSHHPLAGAVKLAGSTRAPHAAG